MHLFGRNFDHDYYFELPCEGERDSALWERLKKQINEGISPKGADEITKNKQEQCRLLHFAQVVNAKSYYRKYAGLIDRVKKSMAENGVIVEIREHETDAQGNGKKGKKTPFVTLRGRIKVRGVDYGKRE